MSLSLLRTGLRSHTAAIPSSTRAFSLTAARANSSQPHKTVHPSDVVSSHVSGPPTVHETPREIAAEVVSDAPRMYLSLTLRPFLGHTATLCPLRSAHLYLVGEMLHRQVRIFRPTKSTMQSAKGKTKRWILDWDTLQGAGRWENPLMGWASSADYMQGTSMAFRSKEDAIAFVSLAFPVQVRRVQMPDGRTCYCSQAPKSSQHRR